MRVLVISDIHGNEEALRAVTEAESVDRVLCLGDLVDYGPRPAEVVRWVRSHAEATVRGNHDTAVARGVPCRSAPAFRRLSEESRKRTIPLLSDEEIRFLGGLPVERSIEIQGLRIRMLHAAPADPLYQYLPASDVAAWERGVADIDADVILVGHTHIPAVLSFGTKLVVNPGSVGLPRDGDPRACYAVLEDRRPLLKRAAYDVRRTVDALAAWGLPQDVATSLEGIYTTGALPASHEAAK